MTFMRFPAMLKGVFPKEERGQSRSVPTGRDRARKALSRGEKREEKKRWLYWELTLAMP